MNKAHIKILPLLVFVSMLAFSVRLAEIVTGFSELAGGVMAASETKPQPAPDQDSLKSAQEAAETHAVEAAKEPETAQEPAVKEETTPAEQGGEKQPAWYDAGDTDTQFSNVRTELYENLAKRREELDKREVDLVTREALLRAAEQEIDRKYNELAQLRQEIEKLLQKQSEEEQARIISLVKIYENMKPKDAARIFDTLDIDVLMAVMSKMSERKLSPIMAEMNPERAKTMTIMLAEQKQLPQLPPAN